MAGIMTLKPLHSRIAHYPTDGHGWLELFDSTRKTQKWSAHKGANKARFIVVGAGVTGLSCARRLAKLHPQDEIIVLDARKVGQAASGRNSGFAVSVSQTGRRYEQSEKSEYQRVNRVNAAGIDLLRELVTNHKIECQWDENGFYYTAADEHAVRESYNFEEFLTRLGEQHTPLDRQQACDLLGTGHYQRVVHLPKGALVQPAMLVEGLAENLPENVTLYENSAVQKIDHGARPGVQLDEGAITANKIFLATNYEAGKLSVLNRYLIGSTLSGSFTRVLNNQERALLGSLPHWGTLSLHGGGATLRLTKDGRISLRNTAEYHGGRLLSDAQLEQRQQIHRKSFEQRYPQLAHVPFEFGWSCVEGISRNQTNFFGAQGENIYYAGGYNGSGVSRGTAFGHALADFACGIDNDLVRDCKNVAPAQWIPPRPLLDIGAWFTVRSRFNGVGLDR